MRRAPRAARARAMRTKSSDRWGMSAAVAWRKLVLKSKGHGATGPVAPSVVAERDRGEVLEQRQARGLREGASDQLLPRSQSASGPSDFTAVEGNRPTCASRRHQASVVSRPWMLSSASLHSAATARRSCQARSSSTPRSVSMTTLGAAESIRRRSSKLRSLTSLDSDASDATGAARRAASRIVHARSSPSPVTLFAATRAVS